MWKCCNCKLIFKMELDKCPECNNELVKLCTNDPGVCEHTDTIVSGIKTCDKCGEFICPICGNHDVEVLSRITGYYSPLSAWNSGKLQEIKDRKKYEVL